MTERDSERRETDGDEAEGRRDRERQTEEREGGEADGVEQHPADWRLHATVAERVCEGAAVHCAVTGGRAAALASRWHMQGTGRTPLMTHLVCQMQLSPDKKPSSCQKQKVPCIS